MPTTIEWFTIAEHIHEIAFNQNGLAIVQVNGKTITVINHQQQLYACAHKCPHAGGIMADGFVKANGQIVCPLHRYEFNITNGRNTSGEGYYLKTYLVQQLPNGTLQIGFEKKGIFGW
jgi:nitrite reductase/ring-hydroxylating ferredoxin subunit